MGGVGECWQGSELVNLVNVVLKVVAMQLDQYSEL